jgi:O-acetyl-ADP-ribose deacetylase (regulator of RNase III)
MDQVRRENTYPSGLVVQIAQGDITAETVDAIVNAANSCLEHGAGVAGAVVRRGGPQIQAESSQWVREHGLVSHAEPAYTNAGNLPCRYVIHAVGPRWGEGDEEVKLGAAIRGSLLLADRLSLGSIAFPAISTGIFGFPKTRAAQVMLSTIQGYLTNNPNSSLKLIRLVLFDQETLQAFVDEWERDDHFAA